MKDCYFFGPSLCNGEGVQCVWVEEARCVRSSTVQYPCAFGAWISSWSRSLVLEEKLRMGEKIRSVAIRVPKNAFLDLLQARSCVLKRRTCNSETIDGI